MLTLKIERLKVINFLLLVIFYFLLFFCFILVIKDFWEYKKVGFNVRTDFLKLAISTTCVLFNISLLTLFRIKDFLYSIGILLLIFFVFPSAILFTNLDKVDYRIFISQNLFFLSVLLIGKIRMNIRSRKFEILQSEKFLLLIVLIGLIPFLILYVPYLNFKNFLLIDIYETRALMAKNVDYLYTNYTYSWFNKFIIPCLLVFGLYSRNFVVILIASLALLFLFLCGAHKAVFVGFVMVVLLYRFEYIQKMNYFLKLIVFMAVLALVTFYLLDNDFLMLMSIRRAFILPNFLDLLYFDFFADNYMYWSESFETGLKTYPYAYEHSYVIGDRYFGLLEFGANNGIVSDGFMNLGMAGVAINILIVSIYLSILNQLNISSKFFGVFFVLIFLFVSSSLTTIMLTHGGIILMLLSFFFIRNTGEKMV